MTNILKDLIITWDLRLELGKFPMQILLSMWHSSYFFFLPLLAVYLLFPNYWITNNTSEFTISVKIILDIASHLKLSRREKYLTMSKHRHSTSVLFLKQSQASVWRGGEVDFALRDPFTEVNMTLKAEVQQTHMARSE